MLPRNRALPGRGRARVPIPCASCSFNVPAVMRLPLSVTPAAARRSAMAKPILDEKTPRRIGDLAMVWRHAANYPRQITFAGLALVTTSAATIAGSRGLRAPVRRA